MKKLALFTLVTLIYNYIIELLIFAGVLLGLFRGDYVITAVAILLGGPGVVAQPWSMYVLLSLRPDNFWLLPLISTAITVPVYALLSRTRILKRDKQRWARLNHRKVATYTTVFVVFALGLCYLSWIDFPPQHRGIPPAVQLEKFPVPVSHSRYYCLSDFIDSEWLWQASMNESDFERFSKMYGLQPLKHEKIGRAFYRMPPYWWRPAVNETTRVLSTPGFPMNDRGNDGDHWLVAWNPDDQLLYVWVKFNF